VVITKERVVYSFFFLFGFWFVHIKVTCKSLLVVLLLVVPTCMQFQLQFYSLGCQKEKQLNLDI